MKPTARDAVIEVARDDMGGHPAVRAWSHLGPTRVEPASLQVLRERSKSSIYRLRGVGAGGSSVIAKRSRSPAAAIERTIYEEVLPHLPVTSPHYYGSSEDHGDSHWFFLEDVGAARYSISNEEHFALAGRWLGRMHTSAAHGAAAARLREGLPDGGPGRYLEHLRAGRRDILGNLSNPALTAEEVAVLEAVVSLQDRLERVWSRVEESCAGLPSTLVHGDFRPKNAYVRRDANGLQLFPIDWEMAGWGMPAADLTRVDLASYETIVREDWPGLDAPSLRRHASIGQVFRLLAAIGWESLSLKYDTRKYLLKPTTSMRVYRDKLPRAIQVAGLA
jgi:hypothetical protein